MSELNSFVCLLATLFSVSGDGEDKKPYITCNSIPLGGDQHLQLERFSADSVLQGMVLDRF